MSTTSRCTGSVNRWTTAFGPGTTLAEIHSSGVAVRSFPGSSASCLAFFRPVKGYAAPRVLVDPDVLPFRPNRGIHVSLAELADPHGVDAHRRFAWEDRTLMPTLTGIEGVAGGWTFAFSHSQKHATLPLVGSDHLSPGSLRLRVLYLDGEPATAARAIENAEREMESEERSLAVKLTGAVPIHLHHDHSVAGLVSEVDLEGRVRAIEDRLGIYELLASYGPAVDTRDKTRVDELWSPNGSYTFDDITLTGSQVAGLVDLDSHTAFIAAGCGHVLSTPTIHLDGDSAVAINYSVVFAHREGRVGPGAGER